GDAELLEPAPDVGRGTPPQDRPGSDRIDLVGLRIEGDQVEVAVLEHSRRTERVRDRADQVVEVHANSLDICMTIRPARSVTWITSARRTGPYSALTS